MYLFLRFLILGFIFAYSSVPVSATENALSLSEQIALPQQNDQKRKVIVLNAPASPEMNALKEKVVQLVHERNAMVLKINRITQEIKSTLTQMKKLKQK